MTRSIKIIFFLLVLNFVFIFSNIFLEIWVTPFSLFLEWIIFFLLGFILVFLVFKNKTKSPFKIPLLLAGFSAMAFLFFVLLHIFVGIGAVIGGFEEPVFFILAVLVSPLIFLISVFKIIILLFKKSFYSKTRR